MKTIDMSKDFAEARARGEAANEIDDLVQRLFVDTIGCCADLDADDQCERCRLRRDAARVLSRLQVSEAEAKSQLATVHEHVAEACALLGADTIPDTWTLRDYAARVVRERNALRNSAAAQVGQEWIKRANELSADLTSATERAERAEAHLARRERDFFRLVNSESNNALKARAAKLVEEIDALKERNRQAVGDWRKVRAELTASATHAESLEAEIATLRTRAEQAEAERDEARALKVPPTVDDLNTALMRAAVAKVERDVALARAEAAEAELAQLRDGYDVVWNEAREAALREAAALAHKHGAISVHYRILSLLDAAPAAEVPHLICDHCGDVAIESRDGLFTDGTGGACMSCGMPGHVSCDTESPAEWAVSDSAEARCNQPGCCAPAAEVSDG